MGKLLNTIKFVNIPSILISEVVQFRIETAGVVTETERQVKVMGPLRRIECLLEPGFGKWGREGRSRAL